MTGTAEKAPRDTPVFSSRLAAKRLLAVKVAAGALVFCAWLLGLAGGAVSGAALIAGSAVARFQLLPSIATAAAAGLSGFGLAWLVSLVITAIAGRWYCAVACPLGFMQDVSRALGCGFRLRLKNVKKISNPAGRKTPRMDASAGSRWWALWRVFLALAGVAAAIAAPALLSWIDPYALATRLAASTASVVWDGLGEAAAGLMISLPASPFRFDLLWLAVAAVPGFVIMAFSYANGRRSFCSALCPAGALLSLAGSRPLFGFRIEPELCTSCGACERLCPTGAASSSGKAIDTSACVSCAECGPACPVGAISYTRIAGLRRGVSSTAARIPEAPAEPKPVSASTAPSSKLAPESVTGKASLLMTRRGFIATGSVGLAAAALTLPAAGLASGNGPVAELSMHGVRRLWAAPPGAVSLDRYLNLCISCGFCVRACPSGVLRQTVALWRFPAVLVPYMDYSRAFCQFDCVACGDACPTGAIQWLSTAAKTVTAVGKSKLDLKVCIVVEKGTRCGACAEHCPTGALSMGSIPGSELPGPLLDETLCIGCGACETVCPSEPVKALVVRGLRVHETARSLPVRPGSGAQAGAADASLGGSPKETGTGGGAEGGTEGFAF